MRQKASHKARLAMNSNSKHPLSSFLVLLVLLVAVLFTVIGQGDLYSSQYEDDDFAFGEEDNCTANTTGGCFLSVPTCAADEFLTFNGTAVFCRTLPDVGFCDCPDLFQNVTETNETRPIVAPLPPPGCEVYKPPTRGAFACLRSPNNIYCSVLCDHRFEFSFTPKNPYYCGLDTQFNWRDFPNGLIRDPLPVCTGFRHRPQLLHRYENYLSSPCYGLTDYTIRLILEDLFAQLREGGCQDCRMEDTFLQCPRVEPTARSYSEVANARPHFRK